jgi:pSer/pThr/pTyr-binding forkhead associated (FHA) protein
MGGTINFMQARLQIVGGPADGCRLVIERLPAVLGRGPACDVVIDDPWASRIHCELYESDGRLIVRDRESRHGTLVNGRPVTEGLVQPGDRLGVGLTTLVASYRPASMRRTAAAPATSL